MTEQFGHKRLAESHHFIVRLPLWIEVGAALAAAHRERRQRILKDLFEREELQDAAINCRMEAQTTLVGSKGAVHLDAVAAVHMDLSFVINPRNAEVNHPLRLDDAFENFAVPILLVPLNGWFNGHKHFRDRLEELRLIRIAFFNNF